MLLLPVPTKRRGNGASCRGVRLGGGGGGGEGGDTRREWGQNESMKKRSAPPLICLRDPAQIAGVENVACLPAPASDSPYIVGERKTTWRNDRGWEGEVKVKIEPLSVFVSVTVCSSATQTCQSL